MQPATDADVMKSDGIDICVNTLGLKSARMARRSEEKAPATPPQSNMAQVGRDDGRNAARPLTGPQPLSSREGACPGRRTPHVSLPRRACPRQASIAVPPGKIWPGLPRCRPASVVVASTTNHDEPADPMAGHDRWPGRILRSMITAATASACATNSVACGTAGRPSPRNGPVTTVCVAYMPCSAARSSSHLAAAGSATSRESFKPSWS